MSNNIHEIKAKLKSMYPGYRFEIKSNDKTLEYIIIVFKERKALNQLAVSTNTPMDQFWALIKDWMLYVMRQR